MIKTLRWIFVIFSITSYAQKPTFTANDVVEPYSGIFAYGTNPGYYSGFNNNAPTDKLLSDLMEKAGLYSMRPKLNDKFVEDYGINVRLNEFKYYVENKKMHDITLFLDGDILAAHQSTETITCSSKTLPSKVFKNMYLPIWDTSDPNKTPINENNYYAYFVYKVIQTYGDYIKFVEVWNEPDFTYSGLGDKNKGEAGNWFDNEPNPCDLPNLNASIPQYVRLLRITYEVVKALKPSLYVTTGGIGYASFLDAMLRVTDNPDGGKVSAEYPLKGGAYFDVLSYHSYPQYNQRIWNTSKGDFDYFRHSDKAVQAMLDQRAKLDNVLNKFGYNGITYPEKIWIITETNIPRKTYTDATWIGSPEAQRNFVVKAFVKAQMNRIVQLYTYKLGDDTDESASTSPKQGMDLMGMYYNLNKATPATAKITPAGIATKSLTSLIHGSVYDPDKTAALNLPEKADGAAFTKGNDTYYVLWAKTSIDRSESATVQYTLPGTPASGAMLYSWDYSTTNKGQAVTGTSITLTGSPIVLKADFTSVASGLNLAALKASVKFYPNPADDSLTIESSNEVGYLSVDLLKANGSLVRKIDIGLQLQKTLDLSDLLSGIYYLKFSNGKTTWTEKVIVE
ncbi:hypothetical protein MYP_3107 [Sporocytophaga myxococcoides]|uniref:Secretion system C-terminal sorting domain-containing protein n=1 Tax=Sporocytophaga myxococcoides TaxID=153721 RepID=A0A098LIE0_9BACT|nr:T9SS type A sorting domain-containing protein [Sporocytophaga myxococcoides]GAL85878.1 hypothetical protein MYP_3107 [Sporocytophaga myxococcoides]